MNSSSLVVSGGQPGEFLTVRHVRAKGTSRQIGRTLAEAALGVYGEAVGPVRAADRVIERARRQWFSIHYPDLLERARGIGDILGVDPESDEWDLSSLATFGASAGCSVAFYPAPGTKEGHGLLSRNFDFPTVTFTEMLGLPARDGERPAAGDPWITELRPDQGYASISIGIADVMGAMDGINEAGLSVALLADGESPHQEPSFGPQVGLSEQQVVRYLLDRCADVDEAKQALLLAKQYYAFLPCHYVVADRSGRSFVWEYSPGHNNEKIVDTDKTQGGRMVCTNHLLHRWPDSAELPDDYGPEGVAGFTYNRWRALSEQISDGAIVDRHDLRAHSESVRFTAPTEGTRTLWHAIYDVDDRSVEYSFYRHDRDGRSEFTEPRSFSLR